MSMIMHWIGVPPDDLEAITAGDDERLFSFLEGAAPLAFDVDKMWHAVHFALNGDAWSTSHQPFGPIVLGGAEFGDDIGYGPARSLTAEEVVAFGDHLEALTPDEFAARIDLAAFATNDLYPGIWDRASEEEVLRTEVRGAYGVIRDGFAKAARQNLGIVICLL